MFERVPKFQNTLGVLEHTDSPAVGRLRIELRECGGHRVGVQIRVHPPDVYAVFFERVTERFECVIPRVFVSQIEDCRVRFSALREKFGVFAPKRCVLHNALYFNPEREFHSCGVCRP